MYLSIDFVKHEDVKNKWKSWSVPSHRSWGAVISLQKHSFVPYHRTLHYLKQPNVNISTRNTYTTPMPWIYWMDLKKVTRATVKSRPINSRASASFQKRKLTRQGLTPKYSQYSIQLDNPHPEFLRITFWSASNI